MIILTKKKYNELLKDFERKNKFLVQAELEKIKKRIINLEFEDISKEESKILKKLEVSENVRTNKRIRRKDKTTRS